MSSEPPSRSFFVPWFTPPSRLPGTYDFVAVGQIFHRFTQGHPIHSLKIATHPDRHFTWIAATNLTRHPTDRLADEELGFTE